MGLKYTNFFDSSKYESSDTQIIICKECSSHLCLSDLILSDNFQGSSGPAYLVDNLINYDSDLTLQETEMRTGTYLIKKVKCHQCKTQLGWNYKKAYSYSETYKEGKFVIEKNFIKLIPNNSSTFLLIAQAKKNSRRRSSGANSSTSTISSSLKSMDNTPTIDDFKVSNDPSSSKLKVTSQRSNSIDFRDIHNGSFLSRLRFQGVDKDEFDEDEDVFVDV